MPRSEDYDDRPPDAPRRAEAQLEHPEDWFQGRDSPYAQSPC